MRCKVRSPRLPYAAMDAPTLLRVGFEEFHAVFRDELSNLDSETMFRQPAADANHIGFLIWHVLRDEDFVVAHTLRDGTERWSSDDWSGRLKIGTAAQGTAFESTLLPTFRYDPAAIWDYAAQVWEQTRHSLSELDPARLDERQTFSETWTLATALTTGCLAHGWSHLGEIRQLRGLRGWKADE
jgi:hypothetical protein